MFKTVIENNNGWVEVMGIALFNFPYTCRPPKYCPEPTDEELLEQLCLQLYNGDLVLIEKKVDYLSPGDIKDLMLEECCVDTIKEINGTIACGNLLSKFTASIPFLQAFFYPPGYSKWANLTSTVNSIRSQEWELFVNTMQALPVLTRKIVSNTAKEHSVKHEEKKSDRKLVLFWRGVADAFE